LNSLISFCDEHKLVRYSGKHTACGIQHEFTTHIDMFDEHSPVILLHGSKREHKLPGAQ